MIQDMTICKGNQGITIRVGAIIVKDGKVLMARNLQWDTLHSVGGRIKFGETSEQALVREVFEETGVKVEIDRLGFIHENYFNGDEDGKIEMFELSLYFYIKNPENFSPAKQTFAEDEICERLEWIPIEGFEGKLYPEFYRTELASPQKGVRHLFTDDRK